MKYIQADLKIYDGGKPADDSPFSNFLYKVVLYSL